MTDGLMTNRTQRNLILNEKDKYKDIKLQPLKGGRGQFGFRLLIGVRAGGARGAAAPPNFGQLFFLGSER